MTIQQLEYILDVQRTGSISQTAKNFMVSQSSVSNSINTLEEELGYPIFERNWQGAVPTEKGLAVLKHAVQVCEHSRLILKAETTGGREVCFDTHMHPLFHDAFADLAQECAGREDITLSHHSGTAEESILRVARGQTGLYATLVMLVKGHTFERIKSMRQIRNLAGELGLHVDVRGSIPLVIRIGPGHPLYEKDELVSADFAEDTLIDNATKALANSYTLRTSLGYRPKHTLCGMDRCARFELIARGLGYHFGPKYAADLDERYGFRNMFVPGTTVLVTVSKSEEPDPETKRYLELLEQKVAAINEE